MGQQPGSFIPDKKSSSKPATFVPDSFIPDNPEDEQGLLSRAWETSGKPLLEFPERWGKSISDWLAEHPEYTTPVANTFRAATGANVPAEYMQEYPHAFGAGVSEFTAPRNLALLGTGKLVSTAAKYGYPTIASIGGRALAAAGIGQMGHGVYSATQAETPEDVIGSLVETGLGGLGLGYGVGAIRGARLNRLQQAPRPAGNLEVGNTPTSTAPDIKFAGSGKTPAASATDLFSGDIRPAETPKIITIKKESLTPERKAEIEAAGYQRGGVYPSGLVYYVHESGLPGYKPPEGGAPTSSQRTIIDDLLDAKKKVEDLDRKIAREQKKNNRPAIDRLIVLRNDALNNYKTIRMNATPAPHDQFVFDQKFPEEISTGDIEATETATGPVKTEPEDVTDLVKRLEDSLNTTAEVNKLLKGVSRGKNEVTLDKPSNNIRRRMERMGFRLVSTTPDGKATFKYVMGPEKPEKMSMHPSEEMEPTREMLSPKLRNEFFLNERPIEEQIPAGSGQDVERAIYEHEINNLAMRLRGEQPVGARILPFEQKEAFDQSVNEIPAPFESGYEPQPNSEQYDWGPISQIPRFQQEIRAFGPNVSDRFAGQPEVLPAEIEGDISPEELERAKTNLSRMLLDEYKQGGDEEMGRQAVDELEGTINTTPLIPQERRLTAGPDFSNLTDSEIPEEPLSSKINGPNQTRSPLSRPPQGFYGADRAEMSSRIKALQAQIQDAYRNQDIDRVIELSQEVDEIKGALAGHRPGRSPAEMPSLHELDVWPGGKEGPQAAKIGPNRGMISVNVRRSAKELTSGYSRSLPAVMVREGVQNALDAIVHSTNGEVSVKITDGSVTISDNGIGMSPDELFTVYSNLHESGKDLDPDSKGGKGVGKATFMFGGERFVVETVKEINGQKIKSGFGGTPEELLTGFDIYPKVVDPNTPTGTTFTTWFDKKTDPNDMAAYWARDMMRDIIEYSRNLKGTILIDKYGYDNYETAPIKSRDVDKQIVSDTIDNGNSNVEIIVPHNVKIGEHGSINVYVLNNGMYQYTDRMWLDETSNGVPDKLIVDIQPLVDENNSKYPFPVQRESVKTDVKTDYENIIKEKILKPVQDRAKIDLVKLWNAMPTMPGSGFRESTFFDSGNRMTDIETRIVLDSPVIKGLSTELDVLFEKILGSSGHTKWYNRLKRVGIYTKPDEYGLHVPHPTDKGSSAILINPFAHFELAATPADAALDIVITAQHEAAHIGDENPTILPDFSAEDLDNPRVGRFLRHYLKESLSQGGRDYGHGMPFLHRLGEIYARFGTKRALQAADRIEKLISGPDGRYHPEIQKLLQIYNESRGRTPATEDILSGTGVKSSIAGGGTASTSSNASSNVGGTTGPNTGIRWRSIAREAYNTPRYLMPAQDLSAPLRQGLGAITYAGWWKAWKPMLQARLSEKAYQQIQQSILDDPLFWPTKDPITGKDSESFAEKIGLHLTDLDSLTPREELVSSNFFEKIVPGLRAGNRAYTTFLNVTRAEMLKSLLKNAERAGLNPYDNLPLTKAIADFINTSTGRGSYGKYDRNIQLLSEIFFAPRLVKSRIDMLNPKNYIMGQPFVRRQYWRSMFGMVGFGLGLATLAKLSGFADSVSTDPNSADFLKIRVGNVRFDPFGGLQQFAVLASRLITGHVTSSASNIEHELGQGFRAQTRREILQNFAANKLHPTIRFLYDWADASQYKPFYMWDRIVQQFIPLALGDIVQVAKENPELLPLAIPAAMFGMGTQIYEPGTQGSKYVNPENDIQFTGGELLDFDRDY